MLNHIHLVNYKSYADEQFEIKPVTLLCGGNSSGKTALLKSILLLKQSFEASGNNHLLLNGPYTNNGLFRSIKRVSSPLDSNMMVEMEFSIDSQSASFRDLCKSIGMAKRKREFSHFVIRASFQFGENAAFPQVGEVEKTSIVFSLCFSENASKDYSGEYQAEIEIAKQKRDQQYTIALYNFPTPLFGRSDYPFKLLPHEWENCTCYFRGMQLVSLYKDNLSKASTSALPVLYTIFRVLAAEFNKINIIGPIREAPLRHYISLDMYSEIGIKGENTAQFLGQYGDSPINCFLPEDSKIRSVPLIDAVVKWANHMGIERPSVVNTDVPGAKLTQIMIGEQNLADVGFGVSQVLPILVEGLTLPSENTLMLEQPEIHLHPKMQMEIADFLVKMAEHGKNLIVETHSDHIINRIVKRALENRVFREKVKIYYIEKRENGNSGWTEVQINEVLGIDEAPEGFFDQYAAETEQILQRGYQNMKSKKD